jgi:hypothetical protein
MSLLTIAGLFIAFAAIVVFSVAKVQYRKAKIFERTAIRLPGTVVDSASRMTAGAHGQGHSHAYLQVVAFTAPNGSRKQFTDSYGVSRASTKQGTPVTVLYQASPERMMVHRDSALFGSRGDMFGMLLSATMLLIACIAIGLSW